MTKFVEKIKKGMTLQGEEIKPTKYCDINVVQTASEEDLDAIIYSMNVILEKR